MSAAHKHRISMLILVGLTLLALLTRGAYLSIYPNGLNQDEAYAAYEAFSLLYYGMDSHGYHNPVYFVSWGSGMNALYSYVTIPFIKLFGLTLTAVRLPQALFGVLTVPVCYALGKELLSRRFGLIFAFLVCISPWHIMLSRWGLESNLAVFFVTAGCLCFVKGLTKNEWWLGAAVFYGLSLYCYATLWLVLPIALAVQVGYAFAVKAVRKRKTAALSVALLGALALLPMLFVAVNLGWISPVVTPFFSIPKLSGFRAGEYSVSGAGNQFYEFYQMLAAQSDSTAHNVLDGFGIYYLFSTPLVVYGLAAMVIDAAAELRGGKKALQDGRFICVLAFLVGTLPAAVLLRYVNINKVNSLWIALICCLAYAVFKLQEQWKKVGLSLLIAYGISFFAFCGFYFGKGQISFQTQGIEQALAACKDSNKTIHLVDTAHPIVLFYTRYPTDRYVQEVVYQNQSEEWQYAQSFGNFSFVPNIEQIDTQAVYLCHWSMENWHSALQSSGMTSQYFGEYAVYGLS